MIKSQITNYKRNFEKLWLGNSESERVYLGRVGFSKRFTLNVEKGFTLIEALVYGFVFTLFLLLVIQVFLTIKNTSANSLSMVNLQQNYARIFTDLNQTIRAAQNVTLPATGGSGSSLALDNGQIVYQLNAGVLEKEVSGNPMVLSDSGVSIISLSFENLGAVGQKASIKVSMTIESNYLLEAERQLSEDFQTTVTLR